MNRMEALSKLVSWNHKGKFVKLVDLPESPLLKQLLDQTEKAIMILKQPKKIPLTEIEDQNSHVVGVICEDCFGKLWDGNDDLFSMCCGGEHFRNAHRNPDVYLEKNYDWKHPEFIFEEDEEEEDY